MWPFRRKKAEIGPPPVPEPWDWDSALGVRLLDFEKREQLFSEAARTGGSYLRVSLDKVGSVSATLSPSGDIDWGMWVPYDPDEGARGSDVSQSKPDDSPHMVIRTSPIEQTARGFIFTLDDLGNSILVSPTSRLPFEYEIDRIKADPSVQKIPVGIGTRPQKYLYVPPSRGT